MSSRNGNGFENRLAQLVAANLGKSVSYTWATARENFLAKTLFAGRCDVVMGAPAGLPGVEVTRPYYRSGYVYLSRRDSHLELASLTDPRLRHLKIGIYLVGDSQTPPAEALSQRGMRANIEGFMSFYDRSADGKASRLIDAIERHRIDIAAVWGPAVGVYTLRATPPLRLVPIQDTRVFAPLRFRYDISMGVRKGDDALCAALDSVIARRAPEIRRLLQSYGVPLLSATRMPRAPHLAYRGG